MRAGLDATEPRWDRPERCFLVDTGAQVSVTPAYKLDKKRGSRGPPLQAANGSTITTYGTRVVCLRFRQRNFQAWLIAADVSRPLLDADFFTNTQLACRHEEPSPDRSRDIFFQAFPAMSVQFRQPTSRLSSLQVISSESS